jgi:hypothetical protein
MGLFTREEYKEFLDGNFQNFRKPRLKMSEPEFWVFSRRVE